MASLLPEPEHDWMISSGSGYSGLARWCNQGGAVRIEACVPATILAIDQEMSFTMPNAPLPALVDLDLVLRPPRPDDAAAWLSLGNDPEIARMYGASRDEVVPPTPEGAVRTIDGFMRHGQVWLIDVGGVIGHIRLDRIDRRDRRASLAIGIGDPARLGQGLGSRAIRLVLGHAFGVIGLHRISVRVAAFNTRAIRAYEKCGFCLEGREREAALVDGEWHDDVMMGILDREFQPGV